jgi:hypothetical protein
MAGDSGAWTTMQFGGATTFPRRFDSTPAACARYVVDVQRMQGRVRNSHLVDEAFAAARSARFEGRG